MRMKFYTIRDIVAETFNRPFLAENAAVATRMVQNSIGEDTDLFRHPEHFSLWEIGEFDTDTAEISPNEHHLRVCEITQLVEKKLE